MEDISLGTLKLGALCAETPKKSRYRTRHLRRCFVLEKENSDVVNAALIGKSISMMDIFKPIYNTMACSFLMI